MTSSSAHGVVAALVTVLLATGSVVAEAQTHPRVGFLSANSAVAMAGRAGAFRNGLWELG